MVGAELLVVSDGGAMIDVVVKVVSLDAGGTRKLTELRKSSMWLAGGN